MRFSPSTLLAALFAVATAPMAFGDNFQPCRNIMPPPPTVAPPCNDVTTSLGLFTLQINKADQAPFANAPGFDPKSGLFISPVLFDNKTIIGRSATLSEGSAADGKGVAVGQSGTFNGVTVAQVTVKDPAKFPAGFEKDSNVEIHTAILNLALTGGGFSVTAGASAPKGSFAAGQINAGEVESIACANPSCNGFPANSFFDVFAEVNTPLGGFHNTAPLVVTANGITTLPPPVLYVHGKTSVVGLVADGNGPGGIWHAGDTIGDFELTGHGPTFKDTSGDIARFEVEMQQQINTDPFFNQEEKQFLDSQIPEPSAMTLLLVGVGAIGGWRLRRNRKVC